MNTLKESLIDAIEECDNCGSTESLCCGASVLLGFCQECKEHSELSHQCSDCESEISENTCKQCCGLCVDCNSLMGK